jgi:hypothetical protein
VPRRAQMRVDPLHHLIRLVAELARDRVDRHGGAGVQRLQPRGTVGVPEPPRPDRPASILLVPLADRAASARRLASARGRPQRPGTEAGPRSPEHDCRQSQPEAAHPLSYPHCPGRLHVDLAFLTGSRRR